MIKKEWLWLADYKQQKQTTMNKIETRGVIKEIKGIEKFDSGFYKRSIIIDQNDNIKSEYPKLLQIDFLKDKSDLVNDLLLDGIYEFKLNLNSNKAGERYFTNVSCWELLN